MTRDEMKKILTPALMNYSKEWESFNLSDLVDFWYAAFGDCDYDLVRRAFDAHMATISFPPKIADINRQIQKMESPEPMGETEAFDRVFKAIGRSSWHSEEEFEKLDPILKKIVGDAQQLQSWAQLSIDDVIKNVRPMIIHDYRTEVQRREDYARLPAEVRTEIDSVNPPRIYRTREHTRLIEDSEPLPPEESAAKIEKARLRIAE